MVQIYGDEQEQEVGQVGRESEAGRRHPHHPGGDGRGLRQVPLHGQQLRRRRER